MEMVKPTAAQIHSSDSSPPSFLPSSSTFNTLHTLFSGSHSKILFITSWLSFGFVLYQTMDLLNYSILAFGTLYVFLLCHWPYPKHTEGIIIRSLSMVAIWMFLVYCMPQFPIIAPMFIMITPSVTFYLSRDMLVTFLTYAFQMFLNKLLLENRCIDALRNLDNSATIYYYPTSSYNHIFSCFYFFSFLVLCFQFVLLTEKQQNQQYQEHAAHSESELTTLQSKFADSQSKLKQLQNTLKKTEGTIRSHEDTLLTIAHECRNPLNGVQSNLELAEAMLSDHSDRQALDVNKIEGLVHNARICGEFLLHHLNDILDAGKIESSTLDINPAPTDIKGQLEKVWAICSESIKRKNLTGNLRLKIDVPPFLLVDGHRIMQVLINLINNSIKFTYKGSIFVNVEWKSLDDTSNFSSFARNRTSCFQHTTTLPTTSIEDLPWISSNNNQPDFVTENSTKKSFLREAHTLDLNQNKFEKGHPLLMRQASSRKGLLIIEVRDTGCGIAQQDLSKLFIKFSQVNSDPSKRKTGTGLGLWLCQKICQKMNGTIEAESRMGVGSVFRMKIPTEICESPLKTNLKKISHVSSNNSERLGDSFGKKKVTAIVIDDLAYNREVHKLLLKKSNCEVIGEASSGKEAVEKFKSHSGKVDLIVIDLEMPEVGGLEACRLIRLHERAQNLKASYIVVVSANTQYSPGKQLGEDKTPLFDHYARKPCPLSEFQKIVDEALMKSMARLSSSFSPKQMMNKKKKKVLVVDDDGFCLEIAKSFFESAQIEALSATNGEEGLQVLKTRHNEIGCVVMDFEMPGMNGRETLMQMKEFLNNIGKENLPIFCMSGNTRPSFVKEMLEIGYKEVYGKPVNWRKLITSVEKVVDHE